MDFAGGERHASRMRSGRWISEGFWVRWAWLEKRSFLMREIGCSSSLSPWWLPKCIVAEHWSSSFFVCSCRITAKEPVRFKLSHLQHLSEVVSWKLSLHNICALETGLSRYLKSLVPRLITSFSLHLDIFLLTANHCRWMMDESYSRQICQL